jgi:DNA-binding beta-propeller fold protein YncE
VRLYIVGALLFVPLFVTSAAEPLRLVTTIALPGVEGRMDHMAVDESGEKLFIAALANNTVELVDLINGRHLKTLGGFREPTGITNVQGSGAIAVASGKGDGVQTIDAKDYRTLKTISVGDDADNLRYDAAAKRLYLGYSAGALAAISPPEGTILGRAALAGHPESFQLELSGPRIFVNVPTAGHIAVVDRGTMQVTTTWPVTGAAANFPMALDEAGHRLFIGCRKPAKLLIYDTATGKEIGASEIVGDTDDLFYDSQRKRVYVSGGEGFIDVLDARQSSALVRIARVPSAGGARTSLFVSQQSRLYVAVPHRGTQKAEIRVYQIQE